ncbi:DUF2835 domain-containing protein [Methylomonas sp. LL1]|uniref:DUF2835 domain-containing protein n=1 Tax=Methylomonas sp. LL1 TaxID=2785785 RepID=UPI0018C3C55F|nr:DUF2835 domain-containing protein [Methylomonas sp. LL1]QPK63704.1 DUF2835 domain-containing protein [Methylomonas sp. LL1]
MSDNQFIRFSMNISYDQYLAFYQGIAKTVSVIADDGRRIVFPAGNIRRFLTKAGIQGYFEMELTPQRKFVGIKKLA